MTDDVRLLRALERLGPHDHLCSVYETPEEHFAVAVPFIRIGLERNERCLYITEAGDLDAVKCAMRDGGIDVEGAIRSGALVVTTKDQTYMQHGTFDPEWMFTYWQEAAQRAQSEGFTSLRATGETEWVVCGGPGLARWMEYESRLTHTLADCNAFALCQYNRRLFPPALLLDIIRTHPIVIYGGTVCRNFYFVPPEEFLAGDQRAREAQRLLDNIRDRERLDEEIRTAYAELEQRVLERTRELRESEERVRCRNLILQAINRIFGEALLQETEAKLGSTCLKVAEEITGSKFGFIGEIGAGGRLDEVAMSDNGWSACKMELPAGHRTAPAGFKIRGLYGKVLLDGAGFFVNDPSAHPASIGLPPGHPRLTSFLGVPLIHMGKVNGMLALANRDGGYRQQDLEAVEALAPAIVQVFQRKRAEAAVRAGEERLRRAQKMESIGVLAGGIAHDFNNLLTGVLGNASLALGAMSPRDANRPLIEALMQAAGKAADLTRQLLAYAGKGSFIIQPVNLSASVREMAKLLRGSVPANVAIDLDLLDDIAPVEADKGQVQQIIMNFVLNASEAIAGSPGSITIRTEMRVVDQAVVEQSQFEIVPGTYVTLSVEDTGAGIEDAIISKIFEPFFTTKFTGRGLGLAAVHGIVRAHKGAVLVYSRPGSGTVFTVLLPAAAAVAAHEPAPAGEQYLSGEGTILVVDDEPVVRAVAKATLEKFGYNVLLAENGVEALDIFGAGQERITAVVLDLTMPLMSGEETCRRLREIRPDVPVLLASGYNQIDVIRQFTGQGFSGFIGKPFSAAMLLSKIKSACGGTAGTR